jgi:formylglycine-generating enzyme required for sulfatase activity
MKFPLLWSLFLLPPVYGAPAQVDDARKQAGECARCHAIAVVEWAYSKHYEAGTDCKACHGASRGHVADERNNVKPDRLPHQAAIAELCLGCHEKECPKSKKTGSCQDCHHVHALVDPQKQPSTRDERLEQLEARRQRYSQLMQAGDQHVKARKWEAAQSAFRGALREEPRDAAATARLKMCERRIKPGLAGFESVGSTFDEATGLPLRVRVVGLDLPMLLVPGGDYDMGSDQFANAKPVHAVRVEPFYLARHELTLNEWVAIMGSNPGTLPGQNSPQAGQVPVGQVSWNDALMVAQKLNERVDGGGFRLPTEAEWEYAARAGGESGEAFDLTAPRAVEQGRPNRLGFFDLAGNMREWCASRMLPYPCRAGDGREASDESGLCVLRGGAYSEPPGWYDPAIRHGERPTRRLPWNGLRLARSIVEKNSLAGSPLANLTRTPRAPVHFPLTQHPGAFVIAE